MSELRQLPADLLHVNTGGHEPIYRQLMMQLQRMVAAGQVSSGDALPSVREVALALGVNPMTVSKAYSLLEVQGVLERRRGMGMLVAAQSSAVSSQMERLDMMRPGLERIAQEAHQLELSPAPVIALLRNLMKGSQG